MSGNVKPDEAKFSGLFLKIHANMDPNHRTVLLSFGSVQEKFERISLTTHVRGPKSHCGFPNVTTVLHKTRNYRWGISWWYSSDYYAIPGNLKIVTPDWRRKTWYSLNPKFFSPEIFREVVNKDAMRTSSWKRVESQLMEEEWPQLFTFWYGLTQGSRQRVGKLQFWGWFNFRLKNGI